MARTDDRDGLNAHFDQNTLARRSIYGGAATFAAQGIRFVFQTTSQIILAHLISPAEFGLVAMVVPLTGLVQLFNDLGLSQATIQRTEISQRELSALFWLNVSCTLVLSLFIPVLAPLVSWFYGQPQLTAITASLSGPVILAGLSAQHMALLNRRMQFVRLACIDVISTVVAAMIGIGVAVLGGGYWALVAMQVGNAAAILLLSWKLARWRPSRPRIERGIGSLVQFGGSITAYNVVEYLTMNVDNVLVGAAYGGISLGLYDRAYRLMIQPLGQLTTPFTRVAVPLLSRLQDRVEAYRQAYVQMLQAMLLVLAPGLVFAIVMADVLVPFLLGAQWHDAAPIFAWLAGGALIIPVSNSSYWLFVSQNRVREQMVWGCTAAAAIVISFVVGLPWGPTGIARSATVCYWIVQTPVMLTVATRQGPVGLHHIVDGCYPILLGSIASGAILWWSMSWLALLTPAVLPFGLVLSYLIHGVVLAILPAGNRILRDAWSMKSVSGWSR